MVASPPVSTIRIASDGSARSECVLRAALTRASRDDGGRAIADTAREFEVPVRIHTRPGDRREEVPDLAPIPVAWRGPGDGDGEEGSCGNASPHMW